MSSDNARFHYPLSNLWPDYLRSATGFGLTMLPMPNVIGGNVIVLGIMLGLAGLFGSFGITTLLRHKSAIGIDDQGLWIEGLRTKALRWTDVAEVDLRYFSTRRDKEKGWMQLKVRGLGRTIKIDSNLNDFDGLMRLVVTAVTRHDLTVTPIGRENLASLGKTLSAKEDNG
jgi:hypothetical protein